MINSVYVTSLALKMYYENPILSFIEVDSLNSNVCVGNSLVDSNAMNLMVDEPQYRKLWSSSWLFPPVCFW